MEDETGVTDLVCVAIKDVLMGDELLSKYSQHTAGARHHVEPVQQHDRPLPVLPQGLPPTFDDMKHGNIINQPYVFHRAPEGQAGDTLRTNARKMLRPMSELWADGPVLLVRLFGLSLDQVQDFERRADPLATPKVVPTFEALVFSRHDLAGRVLVEFCLAADHRQRVLSNYWAGFLLLGQAALPSMTRRDRVLEVRACCQLVCALAGCTLRRSCAPSGCTSCPACVRLRAAPS